MSACSVRHGGGLAAGATTHFDLDPEAWAGGQPGVIEVRGSLITARGEPTPNLTIRRAAGLDRRGRPGPARDARGLRTSTTLNEADRRELAEVKALGNFTQLGCDDNFHLDTLGRRYARFDDGTTLDVRAELVILCGDVKFTADRVRITADRVILIDARVRVVGTDASKLAVITNEIVLRGVNEIATAGGVNMAPFGAPALTLAAARALGLGRLAIDARGNDWARVEGQK